MVLPVSESDAPEWPKWRWWLTRLLIASLVCGGVWWLLSRDATETAYAAALPWLFAFAFLAISLIWTIALLPLMLLMCKLIGIAKRKI